MDPLFRYRALDAHGQEVSGEVHAADETGALSTLSSRGLSAFRLQRQQTRTAFVATSRSGGLSAKEVQRLIQQLATLASAQVPLVETLTTLRRTAGRPAVAQRVEAMLKGVRAGQSLSRQIEAHLPEAPSYVARLADLGETTGSLPKALTDAADRLAHEQAARAELRSALAYPLFLLTSGCLIVLLLFAFVVPRFAKMMGDDLSELPLISRLVIEGGLAVSGNMTTVIAAAVAMLVLLPSLMRRSRIRDRVRDTMCRAPLVGRLLRQAELASWTRTIGVALSNKAALMEALRLGEAGAASEAFRRELEQVRAQVRTGRPLEESLAFVRPRSDPMILDIIRTGRMSGRLGEMMLFAANLYEREARARSKQLTSLAEPVAVLLISIIVGTVIISIVLAMTSIYDLAI